MGETTFHGGKQQTRNLSDFRGGMEAWVERNLNGAQLLTIEPTSAGANGFAGESFVLEIAEYGGRTKRMLLKRKPTQHRYFPEHDFTAERRVQEILARDGRVPMAPFVAFEDSPEYLGSAFYILDFVSGRPAPDRPFYYEAGWVVDLPPEGQREVSKSTMSALAAVHSVPLHETGLSFLRRAAPGQKQLEWDLGLWDRFSQVSWLDGPVGLVPDLRDWLEHNTPDEENLVISWGDARPGNILFDGTDAVAVVDWDMVSSGNREKDLGYLLALDLNAQRFVEKTGSGVHLKHWPSRREMVEFYEAAAGCSIDRKSLRFYRLFAIYQIACMYSRYICMRSDLTDDQKREYVSCDCPPIDQVREELECAHLGGDAN